MNAEEFERSCCEKISHNIVLPQKNWCVINDNNIRFNYSVDKHMKFLVLPSREEAAEFFVEKGIIFSYTLTQDGVKMYRKVLKTTKSKKHEPVQEIVPVEVKWSEIKSLISYNDVLSFVIHHEYEEKISLMGHVKAKVIQFRKYLAA